MEHALRLRSLMGFVPRRYDAGVIEAMALAGVFGPDLDRAGREAALAQTARWLNLGDSEAQWSAELTGEGAVEVNRVWRGVTDNHKIDAAFLTSAEARKLARLAAEQADVYGAPARLVKAGAAADERASRKPPIRCR